MSVLTVLASEFLFSSFRFDILLTSQRYCLSHSPVPVIVVRPGRKLRKAVEKRRADPKRGRHFEVKTPEES